MQRNTGGLGKGAIITTLVGLLFVVMSPAGAFEDVPPSHMFRDDIRAVEAAGITLGCNPPENNLYCPEMAVTRGEMATFLTRALDLPPAENHFTDDDGNVHEDNIAALAKAEITLGCNPPDNTRYCPNMAVRRGEMAAFLRRALDLPVPPEPEGTVIQLVEREQWGAAPPEGSFTSHTISHLTVHHAASPPSPTGPEAFRGWQDYHMSLGWGDLAYHFIVGKDGKVYEGRDWTKVGATATEYDPTGHFLVVVEGNFDNEDPTAEQIDALAKMLAYGAQESGVDPAEVMGHRDHAETSCPGDTLYRHVHDGSLAKKVQEYLDQGPITLE